MLIAARKYTLRSAADYLAEENDGTWRHEFVNGAVYAMAGASDRHNLIRGNLAARLHLNRLPAGCQSFTAEMKLRIKTNVDERYYYPDIFVACDEDREPYTRDRAILVIEVLSPSTERIDRTEKFEAYRSIPTLMEYGLLSQDAIELELFRRRTDWQREFYELDNIVTFESVGFSVNLSQLYEDIAFGDGPPLSSPVALQGSQQ